MIRTARTALIEIIGTIFALISLGLALTAVTALLVFVYALISEGGWIKPLTVCVAAFVLALITRFLAELDRYEYLPPTTTRPRPRRTTRRRTR